MSPLWLMVLLLVSGILGYRFGPEVPRRLALLISLAINLAVFSLPWPLWPVAAAIAVYSLGIAFRET